MLLVLPVVVAEGVAVVSSSGIGLGKSDMTPEIEGRKNDVSNDMSKGSGSAAECNEGDGCRKVESYHSEPEGMDDGRDG